MIEIWLKPPRRIGEIQNSNLKFSRAYAAYIRGSSRNPAVNIYFVMKQLTQKLKSGSMQVLEVPVPALGQGMVLVRNHYSLISGGTEGSTVKTARKGYIGKAKERPMQVRQVIDTVKTQGPAQTYRVVMKKLDAYSPLGYSCAGEVVEVADDVGNLRVGDFVACGGNTASHAEIVAVPANLCTRISPEADLKQATYNTLGAIALQGVRQADLRLGETCAVIGLGLLGQLTCLLLKASGVRTIGIDIEQAMVEMAKDHCLDLALVRNSEGVENKIQEFTNGIGCDAVIITAATDSLDPINFAGAISRKKGTIVVVGTIPTGSDREPHFYKKELTVKMSCSYGPGRYDPEYEEKGRDYPVGYVRWTENRNMQAFQELIASKKIDVSHLTTHIFKLDDAPAAYDMILDKKESFVGILIAYDQESRVSDAPIFVNPQSAIRNPQSVVIGFIGAGSYAQSYLLPSIPKNKDISLKGVMTTTGATSRSVAERVHFEFCTSRQEDILHHDDINTIFIATRHDSHGYYVKKALEAGKNVFVEKPLCLSEEELEEIKLATDSHRQTQTSLPQTPSGEKESSKLTETHIKTNQQSDETISPPILMLGYNRRFSPLTKILKDRLGSGPMSMIYRINAGAIAADSWIQDKETGGGRIIGEVCHFIDYLTFLNSSLPISVYAAAMRDALGLNDTINITLSFENGSTGTISYFANGAKSLSKEYVEIYQSGVTAIVNDYKSLEIHGGKKPFKKKLLSQDKGQKAMVRNFIDTIRQGGPSPITFEEIYAASLTSFKVLESLIRREAVSV